MNTKQSTKSIFGNSIIKNLLMIILTAVALLIVTLFFLNVYTRHNANVKVPNLAGLQVEEANAILKSRGLHIEVIDSIYQKDAIPGAIIEQVPEANSNVKEGRAIYVSIYSKMPQQVAVPELVDYSLRQAQALLVSMGFTQLAIEEVSSEYAGLVVSVEYRGRKIEPNEKIPVGSPLKLIVGNGQPVDTLRIDGNDIIPSDHIPPQEPDRGKVENQSVPRQQNNNIDESFF